MFNLWLNKTDDFLCLNVRNIFENLEDTYQDKNKEINLIQELQHLELDPFVSIKNNSSSFERTVKFKLKAIVGIFFVLLPLISFLILFNFAGIDYSYAFVATFGVAIFASTRMDKIAARYSDFRHSLI
ncbi:hypothetical protein [Sulfurimonas sp.]